MIKHSLLGSMQWAAASAAHDDNASLHVQDLQQGQAGMGGRLVGWTCELTGLAGKGIRNLYWTCKLQFVQHSQQWAYRCQKYAMMSSSKQKNWCMRIPLAADTPQDSCLGPKGSHSVAESAPGVVWSSRRTVPTEQHQLCRQEQALTKATFFKAKQVCQPNVTFKCSNCANDQYDIYCQENPFTVQAIPSIQQANLR